MHVNNNLQYTRTKQYNSTPALNAIILYDETNMIMISYVASIVQCIIIILLLYLHAYNYYQYEIVTCNYMYM